MLCNFLMRRLQDIFWINCFAHEHIKNCPQSILYGPLEIFSKCQLVQNQPKSHILFHKNGLPRDFYIMTLLAAHLALTLHDDIQKINKYVAVWLKNSMAVSENPNKDILCITTTWYKPDVLIGLSFFWLTWLCTAVFHFNKAHSFIIALLARAKLISEMVGY